MSFRSLLRSAALLALISSLGAYVAAQDVRDANASAQAGTGAAEMRYYVLFRRLVNPAPPQNRPSSDSQDQSNQAARPRPDYRAMFHRSASLTDAEGRVLDQIAEDCISKTDKLDQQAHEIIAARRAEVRAGKAPPDAPPPSVLSDLQKQRDDVIRNAIEQLRTQFGEAEFKRLNDYVTQHSGTSRITLPPPSKKPLPLDVKIALLDRSNDPAPARFAAKEKFTVEVSMLNNSTQMISIKLSELYEWLQLETPGRSEVIGRVSPRFLFEKATADARADETLIDLPPNQLHVVTQINFGPGAVSLPPGQYQLTVHPRVLLNRPPNSDFLQLSLEPFAFEIVP